MEPQRLQAVTLHESLRQRRRTPGVGGAEVGTRKDNRVPTRGNAAVQVPVRGTGAATPSETQWGATQAPRAQSQGTQESLMQRCGLLHSAKPGLHGGSPKTALVPHRQLGKRRQVHIQHPVQTRRKYCAAWRTVA